MHLYFLGVFGFKCRRSCLRYLFKVAQYAERILDNSENTSAGLNFQQYNLTSAITKNKNIAGMDPRNELFKYQNGKEYTKVHYDGDVKVLAQKTAEQEEEDET